MINTGRPVLTAVRRGEALDEIELLDATGTVLILHAHGVTADEQHRTRELAFTLLTVALVP